MLLAKEEKEEHNMSILNPFHLRSSTRPFMMSFQHGTYELDCSLEETDRHTSVQCPVCGPRNGSEQAPHVSS